jgi:primosomal protein N' (replication factor Y)
MIAKIAVAAANFAIDKPYSYGIPQGMTLLPGVRVTVPFGRCNRPSEGIVLQLEAGDDAGLKLVSDCLDTEPLLSETMLRLAAFMRERYFCTLYDAVRAILPAGLWFRNDDTYSLTEDRTWKDAPIRQNDARKLLQILEDLGGAAKEQQLRAALQEEDAFEKAIAYLLRKKPLPASLCPIIANGVIVGLVLALSFNLPALLTMAEVAVGEIGAVAIGMIILSGMKRAKVDLTRLG